MHLQTHDLSSVLMHHVDVLFLNRETIERLLAQITSVASTVEPKTVFCTWCFWSLWRESQVGTSTGWVYLSSGRVRNLGTQQPAAQVRTLCAPLSVSLMQDFRRKLAPHCAYICFYFLFIYIFILISRHLFPLPYFRKIKLFITYFVFF